MSEWTGVDYKAAAADIVAYWHSLQPNSRAWYVEPGDLHNLLDMATDEIERLRVGSVGDTQP